mgnify:CR=1 FL=1
MPFFRCEHTIRKNTRQVAVRKVLTTLGRSAGNDIVLDDPMVASTHAQLMRKGKVHTLSLVDRQAELYVNGRRCRVAELGHGDTVLLGAWKLVFDKGELTEEIPTPSDELPLDVLERLVTLSQDMMRDTTPSRLFTSLLKGLLDLTKAEKGFVIVLQDGERHLAAAHNVDNERLDITKVSDSIVNQVVEHLQPVIVSDAMSDARFGRAKSVVDLKLSSVMCVPLIYRKDLLGVLYLGNDKVTDLFGERDLAMLKIYAAQASLVVYHALQLNQLLLDNKNLRSQLQSSSQGQMIGTCPPMKAMFRVLRRVAPTDLSVLVLGETGTGKELVARELHKLSGRSKQAFIAINCGAIPENLLESEFFGHKKGAFTGAVSDHKGRFQMADKGTLFLDEIGEMLPSLQVKLLRALQTREVTPVGASKPQRVDVRVVAATNRDLLAEMRDGNFREDLYYRLAVIPIRLPPLRDRREDISLLVRYLIELVNQRTAVPVRGITRRALDTLIAWDWPGNVRELGATLERMVVMAEEPVLSIDDVPSHIRAHVGLLDEEEDEPGSSDPHARPSLPEDGLKLADAVLAFENSLIVQALERTGWNKNKAAKLLQMNRTTLVEKLKKRGLTSQEEAEASGSGS